LQRYPALFSFAVSVRLLIFWSSPRQRL